MLDGSHITISLYRVDKGEKEKQYLPLSGDWNEYLGFSTFGKPNPSPRGGGRYSWGGRQFLCAIGFYFRIYQEWQDKNDNPGLKSFLELDPEESTTGIPRILDKVFW